MECGRLVRTSPRRQQLADEASATPLAIHSRLAVKRLATAVILFAAALAAHLVYWRLSNGDYFYPDSATYLVPAQNLAHGLGFVNWLHVPETIRTPGYCVFLMPFASNAAAIVFVQHLLAALLAAVIYLITASWTGSERAAIAAGAMFAFDPAILHYANKVLSETVFAVVFMAICIAAQRLRSARGAVIAGLATGALVLIRPVAILWFLIIAFYLFVSARRQLIAAFVISSFLLPLGWGMRNRIRTSVFTIASVAGTNMLMYRGAGALAIMDDYEFKDALADRQKQLLEEADAMIRRSEHVENRDVLPHAVQARYFSAIGRRVLLQHPVGAFFITLHGIEINLFDSDWEAIWVVSRVPPTILRMTLDGIVYTEFLLAIAGIAVLWRRDRALGGFVALTLLYFIVISAGGESEARFRVPVMPLYAIAAASGLLIFRSGAAPDSR